VARHQRSGYSDAGIAACRRYCGAARRLWAWPPCVSGCGLLGAVPTAPRVSLPPPPVPPPQFPRCVASHRMHRIIARIESCGMTSKLVVQLHCVRASLVQDSRRRTMPPSWMHPPMPKDEADRACTHHPPDCPPAHRLLLLVDRRRSCGGAINRTPRQLTAKRRRLGPHSAGMPVMRVNPLPLRRRDVLGARWVASDE